MTTFGGAIIMRSAFTGALMFLVGLVPALAQFRTPTVDGVIATNEYGIHTNGANQYTTGGAIWYMTWDANNLFIGVSGTNTDDAVVVYIDVNPIAPINGGNNADGAIVGQTYNNTNFEALPFRADRVVYFKDGFTEIRSAAGGGWPSVATNVGSYASVPGVREYSIPWGSLGGRPAAFLWFGYVANASGTVYGEMPPENAEGSIGTSARYERYYNVGGTEDANSTWPFSRNSLVFNRTSDWNDAGNLNVYDFTMNAPGRTITRSANSDSWIIGSNLHIEAGTVSFGNAYSFAAVDCDVLIGVNGTLALSSNAEGGLIVRRHLLPSGTFVTNGRRVRFEGGRNQTIGGSPVFDELMISKTGGMVTLVQDARVNGTLTLAAGKIQLANNNSLTIGAHGNITGAHAGAYIVTLGTGVLKRDSVGNTPITFPVGTETSFNPVTISNNGAPDEFRVNVKPEFDAPPSDPSRVVNRQWNIAEAVPGGSNATISLQWNSGDQGAQFNPANPVNMLRHDGVRWLTTPATVTSNGPYTATASGFSDFNKFTVGNAGATAVGDDGNAPVVFALHQNYPNPFNPSTEIRFSVENTNRATLDVYNTLGQKMATLFDDVAQAGSLYKVKFSATGLASGVYYYKLTSGAKSELKKLILMK